MSDAQPFGLLVLVVALVGLAAVLSNRLSEHVRIPTPAIFLAGAAIAARVAPSVTALPHRTSERLVTVALIAILFDGGMHIGWTKFRAAAGSITVIGVAGTFLTAAAVALLCHTVLHLDWWAALLVGTAIAPTDPAVVFSVLGKREVAGRSATILEGESGMNDPVGIALMAGLLAAGGVSASAMTGVAGQFMLQMVVGLVIGLVGGRALLWFMRRIALPSEALYPVRTLASAMAIFGAAAALNGSGFLAVFVAGILIGEERAPYKLEIERFHSALASLGEIVAFVVLGLSVELGVLARTDVWAAGLLLGAVGAFVIRPIALGLCLLPLDLTRNERIFTLWAGLRGAVPLLLGSLLLSTELADKERLYGIVVVAVLFSVLVQGSTVPTAARLLRIPMRTVEPEPWAWGVRLRSEPEHVHRFVVRDGSPADGALIEDLTNLSENVWVSLVIRAASLVAVRGDTRLQAGDEVLVLAPDEERAQVASVFTGPPANTTPNP